MAKIKIDIDALKSDSSVLEQRINDLQGLNARLESLIARIQSSWEGQASIVYIAKITAQAAKAKRMVEVLTEYKKYVDSAVNKFTSLDNRAANQIRGSF